VAGLKGCGGSGGSDSALLGVKGGGPFAVVFVVGAEGPLVVGLGGSDDGEFVSGTDGEIV